MTGYERRKEQKRGQILNAAGELFRKQGFRKTTIDEVANRAGVSKVTVYNHFADKRGLIEESLRKVTREKIEQYRGILTSDRPWRQRLEAVILDKFQMVKDYSGEVLETLYNEMPDLITEIRHLKVQMQNEVTFEFLEEGRELGFVPEYATNEAVALFLECFARGMDSFDEMYRRMGVEPHLAEDLISLITYGMVQKSPG
jgi:AcrR family transcriptional regulator